MHTFYKMTKFSFSKLELLENRNVQQIARKISLKKTKYLFKLVIQKLNSIE